MLYTQHFPAAGKDAIRGLHRNEDGSIIAVGYKGGAYDDESFIVTSAQAFMMKIDADLSTVLWEKDIPEFMELRRVVKAKDGSGYAAVGNMMPAGSEFVNLAMYFTQGLGDNGSAPLARYKPMVRATPTTWTWTWTATTSSAATRCRSILMAPTVPAAGKAPPSR